MFESGLTHDDQLQKYPVISSGNDKIDELLNGGFRWNLIHLLHGSLKFISRLLHELAVSIQVKSFQDNKKIAWVVGDNRFQPYEISKIAVRKNLSPTKILDNILDQSVKLF